MYIKLMKFVDQPSCSDGHFKEYKRTLYIFAFKRSFGISWTWARDSHNRICTSPFNNRMNYTAWAWNYGYLRFHLTKKIC